MPVFLLLAAHKIALSCAKHIVIKLLRQCSPALANRSDFNTAWRLRNYIRYHSKNTYLPVVKK